VGRQWKSDGPRAVNKMKFVLFFPESGSTSWAGPTVLLAALRARPSGQNDKQKVVLNYVLSFSEAYLNDILMKFV
jgi:hypothetical protein